MTTEEKRRWDELCRQAAAEKDSEKLALIKREMDRILAEKRHRLDEQAFHSDLDKAA